jgi:hypothetical protein
MTWGRRQRQNFDIRDDVRFDVVGNQIGQAFFERERIPCAARIAGAI